MFKDEIKVKMVSALGMQLGEMIMPKSMEKGLIETYFKSKTIENSYLFINGKEITDNKNYNQFKKDI